MNIFLGLCKVLFVSPLAYHFWLATVAGGKDVIAASVVATGVLALLSPGGELCGSLITALGVVAAWHQGSLGEQPLFAFSTIGGCCVVFALSLSLKRLRAAQSPRAESSELLGKKGL